jgi:hypothetical protein
MSVVGREKAEVPGAMMVVAFRLGLGACWLVIVDLLAEQQ